MFAGQYVNALFASDAEDTAKTFMWIIGILMVLIVIWSFQKVPAMYWVALVSLNFQALLFCFQYEKIVHMVEKWNNTKKDVATEKAPSATDQQAKEWTEGQQIAIGVAVFPFLLPMIAAALVGSVAANAFVGVAAFTGFSLLQTLILAKATEQDQVLEGLKPLIRSALPTIGFIINLVKALHEAKGNATPLP